MYTTQGFVRTRSDILRKRAFNTMILIMRDAEKDNLYYTPIGIFAAPIVEFLQTKGILKNWNEARFFIWDGYEGYQKWLQLKTAVREVFLKDNEMYSKQKYYFKDIDYILTAKNQNYTFSTKEQESFFKLNELVDSLKIIDSELEDKNMLDLWLDDCAKINGDNNFLRILK